MNAERLLQHFATIENAPEAIARLRRFILDLAVRGKVAPQDTNDEPASELVKQIEAEKIKAALARGRREAPLPEIAVGDWPYQIPKGWQWARIRQITSDRGQAVPDQDFTYIDVTAINKEVGRIEGASVVSAHEAPSRARKIVCKGDVLYSCVRPYLLNVAINDCDFSPPPIASTAFAILNGFGLVLSRYQWIVLRSPFMVQCVETKMRGQAYPAINDADFSMLPFPLPPLAEQRRIIAKTDELMLLCDRLEAANGEREAVRDRLVTTSFARLTRRTSGDLFSDQEADARLVLDHLSALTVTSKHIKQLRQTILNLAIRGKLVAQDPNDEPASELLKRIEDHRSSVQRLRQRKSQVPEAQQSTHEFDVPPSWEWTTLGTLSLEMRYGTSRKCGYERTGTPVLRIPNISSGTVDTEDLKFGPLTESEANDLSVRCGDLLVIRSNGSLDIVGRVAEVGPSALGMSFAGYLVRIRLSTDNVVPRYVWLAMNTDCVRHQIEKPIRSTVGLKNVNSTELSALKIPLPPLAEQRRIVALADRLTSLCSLLDAEVLAGRKVARKLFDAMLDEALTPIQERHELEAAQ